MFNALHTQLDYIMNIFVYTYAMYNIKYIDIYRLIVVLIIFTKIHKYILCMHHLCRSGRSGQTDTYVRQRADIRNEYVFQK